MLPTCDNTSVLYVYAETFCGWYFDPDRTRLLLRLLRCWLVVILPLLREFFLVIEVTMGTSSTTRPNNSPSREFLTVVHKRFVQTHSCSYLYFCILVSCLLASTFRVIHFFSL